MALLSQHLHSQHAALWNNVELSFQPEALEAFRDSVCVGMLGFWRLPASLTFPLSSSTFVIPYVIPSLVLLDLEPNAHLWGYSLPPALLCPLAPKPILGLS